MAPRSRGTVTDARADAAPGTTHRHWTDEKVGAESPASHTPMFEKRETSGLGRSLECSTFPKIHGNSTFNSDKKEKKTKHGELVCTNKGN